MSEISGFLRARYAEARDRENGKRRSIPSPFDGRDVVWQSDAEGERLLVDGHPFPLHRYLETATEPAPDPAVLADLDAKLAIVEHMDDLLKYADGDTEVDHYGALDAAEHTLRHLAQPFAGHPDHMGEAWAP